MAGVQYPFVVVYLGEELSYAGPTWEGWQVGRAWIGNEYVFGVVPSNETAYTPQHTPIPKDTDLTCGLGGAST
jgi:hypothetical protein